MRALCWFFGVWIVFSLLSIVMLVPVERAFINGFLLATLMVIIRALSCVYAFLRYGDKR